MSDFTENNRKYFDQLSTTYKDRFADGIKMVASQTLEHRQWISDRWTDTEAGHGRELRMLDYACGPGSISLTLAPFLTEVIGVDLSNSMVDEFNSRVKGVGLGDKVTGYTADLLADSTPEEFFGEKFSNFDVLTVSMALHHFEYPDRALQQLVKRLKQDGVCYIVDLVPHISDGAHDHHHGHGHGNGYGYEHGHGHGNGHGHDHGHASHGHDFGEATHTVKTHGFSREDMQKLFEGAGLTVRFDYKVLPEPVTFTMDEKTISKTGFIARAQLG